VSRIRWSHSARRDYRDVVEWLNDRNPAAASRIADAIENRLAMLAMMPANW
jgi:plasmid stabilization system protein ParE